MRAYARDFLSALRPERPDGRRIATIPIVFSADEFTTRSYRQTASISVLLIFGILDGRADVGIGPYNMLCRITTANYYQNEQNQNLMSAIRDCVWYTCQNDKLSEMYLPCARRGRSGRGAAKKSRASARNMAHLQAHLFAYFFWQDSWNQIANQRSVCNLERTSNGTDETCRLRRGEGCGVCEDEPPETQLRRCRI